MDGSSSAFAPEAVWGRPRRFAARIFSLRRRVYHILYCPLPALLNDTSRSGHFVTIRTTSNLGHIFKGEDRRRYVAWYDFEHHVILEPTAIPVHDACFTISERAIAYSIAPEAGLDRADEHSPPKSMEDIYQILMDRLSETAKRHSMTHRAFLRVFEPHWYYGCEWSQHPHLWTRWEQRGNRWQVHSENDFEVTAMPPR